MILPMLIAVRLGRSDKQIISKYIHKISWKHLGDEMKRKTVKLPPSYHSP